MKTDATGGQIAWSGAANYSKLRSQELGLEIIEVNATGERTKGAINKLVGEATQSCRLAKGGGAHKVALPPYVPSKHMYRHDTKYGWFLACPGLWFGGQQVSLLLYL